MRLRRFILALVARRLFGTYASYRNRTLTFIKASLPCQPWHFSEITSSDCV
nr:MAG TPA: hypothetical protein [Caudoviricetes sp.]DAS56702.1 MAG TPA: hypothetical protein [Caudoviricetes sp.]